MAKRKAKRTRMAGRRGLSDKVRSYLRDRGPAQTADIAADLRETSRRVQNALHSLQTIGHVRRGEERGQRMYERGRHPHLWHYAEVAP